MKLNIYRGGKVFIYLDNLRLIVDKSKEVINGQTQHPY